MQSQAVLSKEHLVKGTNVEEYAEKLKPQHTNDNEKTNQLRQFYSYPGGGCPFLTMNTGVKVSNTDSSLRAGPRGPLLMEDIHFREKLTHFDHERIPERVVHARGSAAHGYFQMYKSIPELSYAHVFNTTEPTPVFVRFSTVLGSRGSSDTVRDVRGFATRFYTKEGNWDIVGNNIPVFFIQDGIKFPDLIHAGKPSPDNEIPQAQTGHDNFWDFISLTPEAAHMIMWALSDRAIPRSYRMMNGFGVNTFTLINAQGVRRFVKFHWKPILGVHGLVWDEAQKLSGVDPDYHRRDLWDAIEFGAAPEWELGLQVVEEADEHKFDFDILDDTKIIPEELVPIRYVGKMVLNRNPAEFFPEVEQVAFCTQNVVPGIDFSDDPMLQARNFSYLDTQLIRLGGPNFTEIPINRPICPVMNNQRDGYHRATIVPGKLNYWPNRHALPKPADIEEGDHTQLNTANGAPATNARYPPGNGFINYPERINDITCRLRGPKFKEHFSQATLFYRSLTAIEQRHTLDAALNELGHVDDLGVRERMVHNILNNIDHEFAHSVALGIGVKPPSTVGQHFKEPALLSPCLAMERTEKNSIATRRVVFLIADGFDLTQYNEIKAGLSAAGAMPFTISLRKGPIQSSSTISSSTLATEHGATSADAQFTFTTAKSVLYDAFVIIGGAQSGETLKKCGSCIYFIREAFKHCKAIMAVGEGIGLLEAAALPGVELASQANATSVINSLGVISAYEYSSTSSESTIGEALKSLIGKLKGTAKLGAATLAFMDAVRQHRYWDRVIDEVAA